MQVVRDEENAPPLEEMSIAENAKCLDRGRSPALHVARTAAAEQVSFDSRRDEGQMDDVHVAIELEALPRSSGVEPHEDSRRVRVPGGFALDHESVVAEQFRESVENSAGITGGGGDCDETRGRVKQPVATD